MGKSRGNRLSKQSAYFYWFGNSSMSGIQVMANSNYVNMNDNSNMPKNVYGTCYGITWGANANLTKLPTMYMSLQTMNRCFKDIAKLKNVDLSYISLQKQLTYFDYSECFSGCADLVEIKGMPLSKSFTYGIGNYNTFYGCAKLETISFSGDGLINVSQALDMSDCNSLSEQSYLAIAWRLDPNSSNKTWNAESSSATTPSTKHVRLNQSGDGLEYCNSGDSGDLGTLAEYVTSKGWTLSLQ